MKNRVPLLLFIVFMFCLVSSQQTHALIAAHYNYNVCDTCHALHNGPSQSGGLLSEVDSESTCLGCHGPLGIATEVAIHDPGNVGKGNPGYITCLECHNPHTNGDPAEPTSPNPWPNAEGGYNTKLVGMEFDFNDTDGSRSRLSVAQIRAETPGGLGSLVDVVFENSGDFSRGASNNGPCQICHNPGPTTGGESGAGDFANHAWGDNCASCHMHSDGFRKRHCVECHDDNATLSAIAPRVLDKSGVSVSAIGSHLQSASGEAIVGLTDFEWTAQCIKCHTGHSGDVIIPNNATVGIDYQMTGGIGLGGSATLAGATFEAEICWDCHDNNTGGTVSEWNALTDHGFTVTGGSDWTAVSFDLDGTTVPTKTTTAIHSVNAAIPEATASSVTANLTWALNSGWGADEATISSTKTLETAADIRCSYCHDVHGTFGGTDTDAAPYLRGTWLHNPYVVNALERPPESGDSWTGNRWSHFDTGDTVPRLRTDAAGGNQIGGFQIDQNNNFPTSGESLASTAGLCTLCHGTDINNMDYFTTETLWVGNNGHANAVLGGTRVGAVDLFDARNRNSQLSTAMGFYMAGQGADNWDNLNNIDQWGNQEVSGLNEDRNRLLPYGDNGDNDRPDNDNTSGDSGTPPRWTGYYGSLANAGTPRNTDVFSAAYDTWYSSGGIGANGGGSGRAHDFSCSKCHTPHASGLPALLVTNCLDYTISDWSVSASGPKNGSAVTLGPSATNRWALEAMNNCHRKDDANSPGWNLLAPRQ